MIRYAHLGEIRLAWEEVGAGSRPLVLVHGFTGSRDDWSDVRPQLAQLGRAVLYDQRGHGASSHPGRPDAYTFDQLVDDLTGLLASLSIDGCDVLGHSLGGAVALRYALDHPELVTSLILMDTSTRVPEPVHVELLIAARAVAAHGLDALAAQLARQPLTGEDALIAARTGEVAVRRRLIDQLCAVDPVAFTALAAAIIQQDSIADRLSEISCPTTVLVGAVDEPFLEPARELAAGIRGAALVEIPGAGHSPQKSAPADWLSAIEQHLLRVRR